jgi:RNA polymerase-binding transcription factor DksA
MAPWRSPEDLVALEHELQVDRQETAARVGELAGQFDGIVESAALEAPDDEHDPEGSTIGFERAQLAALIDQARAHLEDVDGALVRLRSGSYGTCEDCGDPISHERLLARPASRTCIRCAERAGRRR